MISAWAISALLHAVLLVLLALVILQGPSASEIVGQVMLELTETENNTSDHPNMAMDSGASGGAPSHERVQPQARSEASEAPPQVLPATSAAGPSIEAELLNPPIPQHTAYADPALSMLAELAAEPAAQTAIGQDANPLLQGTSPGFQQMIGGMRGRGLDVVIVFDATNSMKPYVDQAQQRIRDVINIISGLLTSNGRPPANLRFGVVAFKDYGDDYGLDVVRGLPLTKDVEAVQSFIDRIHVSGGGDEPEPTHRALLAATDREGMGWRNIKKNIIILVSDAPVHNDGRRDAVMIASRFTRRFKGTINVIDVNPQHRKVLPDLADIAEAGNGSAFTLADEDAFWRYLIVSIFGERFERDVQTIVERYTQSP